MMAEAPTLHAAVGRFPAPEANLAAWGLTIGLSLLIESPVILLLTTTIALVKDRPSFIALRQFMLTLCVICTLITALVAFTPLYGFVTKSLMRQPEGVVTLARAPLGVMLLWSAFIAWRRFFQGVLVRFGQSHWMTWGTALRLLAIGGVAYYFARDGALRAWPTGALTAAFAIMMGVFVEAVASTVFAQKTVRELPEGDEPLSQRTIARFHAPLALNTLLALLAQPLTAAALARLPNSEQTLAAWPVAFGVLLVMRGWSLSLQELTVARLKAGDSARSLLHFSLLVGGLTSLATLAIPLTGMLTRYLTALHTPVALWPLVERATLLGATLPLLTALGSFVRGRLVARGRTSATLGGMSLALLVQCGTLGGATALQADGMRAGILAMALSLLAEAGFLLAQSRGSRSSNAPS